MYSFYSRSVNRAAILDHWFRVTEVFVEFLSGNSSLREFLGFFSDNIADRGAQKTGLPSSNGTHHHGQLGYDIISSF